MRSAGDLQLQTVTQDLLLFVILPATGLHGSHGRQTELGEDRFIFWCGRKALAACGVGALDVGSMCSGSGIQDLQSPLQGPECWKLEPSSCTFSLGLCTHTHLPRARVVVSTPGAPFLTGAERHTWKDICSRELRASPTSPGLCS